MTSGRRWSLVALGVALLIAVPLGVRAIPPSNSDITATALLARIEESKGASYSGYAESLGTLQLPVSDHFDDVGDLFGQRTRMRVWWQSSDRWRVDRLLATGEVDLIHRTGSTTSWDYERNLVTRSPDPKIRLPQVSDLLPPQVAYRLLAGATADEVTRLESVRVAGETAPGLRLTPTDPRSSIAHIDVWADEASGVPLRVEVYGKDASQAAVTSEFMDFASGDPAASELALPAPPYAYVRHDDVIDIADAANRFAPIRAPETLVGLARSTDSPLRGVGVYGTGATRLIALPLWDGAAEPLRHQLKLTPGSRRVAGGIVLDVGPLHLLLTRVGDGGGWLLAGTLTDDALVEASHTVGDHLVLAG